MIDFTLGQRWISLTEPELGLGMLVFADRRTLQIRFDASDCTRTYTQTAAPVKRLIFKHADTIRLKNGSSRVITRVDDEDGLVYYHSDEGRFCETELADSLLVSKPQERLLAGLGDKLSLFDLRYDILRAKAGYDASPTKGFLGGQVDLLPHQFYIADTIANRFIPRVLLSDETGLGKTIEACLILHKMLVCHRMSRALIVVPQALLHQWFIELYRKFNLSFMICSESYCATLEQSQPLDNPFLHHQLCLIDLDLLKNARRYKQILSAGWDMLVIDEAHHITDNKAVFSGISALASAAPGLMLLTATPEQMGLENHFRHLQLIDPEKYFDYDIFQRESEQYEKTAALIRNKPLDDPSVQNYLDTFGPGRVIFKNRRSVVEGFPKRLCRAIALKADADIRSKADKEMMDPDDFSLSNDPRIDCLVKLIRQNEKILVIARTKEKAAAIEKALAEHIHVSVARFDESMTLMQRDRHAAFFAQPDGAQVLICSEIGSEGRNFQFVHHLFLFDLPMNPELVEQRIGRLDRIGQKNDIHIWVPHIKNSAYHVLAAWFEKGLQIFDHHVDGAAEVFNRFKDRLDKIIDKTCSQGKIPHKSLEKLITDTRRFCIKTKHDRDRGQNILLQLNSFRPDRAALMIEQLKRMDKTKALSTILIRTWDHYGIEANFFSSDVFTLDSRMITDDAFPLPENTDSAMTFDRSVAIARDELDLITWDHLLVHQTFEYFLTNHTGSSAFAILPGQPEPGLLLETIFVPECVAPLDLNMEQYLSPDPIRILIDAHGEQVTEFEDAEAFGALLEPDNPAWFKEMDQVSQTLIPSMIASAENIAGQFCKKLVAKGQLRIEKELGHEIDRLIFLRKINPGISDEEIRTAKDKKTLRLSHITGTAVKLDCLRLIRVIPG